MYIGTCIASALLEKSSLQKGVDLEIIDLNN